MGFKEDISRQFGDIGRKTSDFMEETRLRGGIRSLESDLKELYASAGEAAFSMWEKGDVDLERLDRSFQVIKRRLEEIEEKKAQIDRLKEGSEAVAGEGGNAGPQTGTKGRTVGPKDGPAETGKMPEKKQAGADVAQTGQPGAGAAQAEQVQEGTSASQPELKQAQEGAEAARVEQTQTGTGASQPEWKQAQEGVGAAQAGQAQTGTGTVQTEMGAIQPEQPAQMKVSGDQAGTGAVQAEQVQTGTSASQADPVPAMQDAETPSPELSDVMIEEDETGEQPSLGVLAQDPAGPADPPSQPPQEGPAPGEEQGVRCPRCGTICPQGANFCRKCGARLNGEQTWATGDKDGR